MQRRAAYERTQLACIQSNNEKAYDLLICRQSAGPAHALLTEHTIC